jgi:hypothetical protein
VIEEKIYLARIKREKPAQQKVGRRSERVEEIEEDVVVVEAEPQVVVAEPEVVEAASPKRRGGKKVLVLFVALLAVIVGVVGTKLVKQAQEQTEIRKASVYLDQSRKEEQSKEAAEQQSISESQSIEQSRSMEASLSESESESIAASESISASQSEEAARQSVDLRDVYRGDFSSITGKWENSEGRTVYVYSDGRIRMSDWNSSSSSRLYIGEYDSYNSATDVYTSNPVTKSGSSVSWTFILYGDYDNTGRLALVLADSWKQGSYDESDVYYKD